MASSRELLNFLLKQCEELSSQAMMGEFVLYYQEKVVGGIYDDRLLVKPTPSAKAMLPQLCWELPYEGAKEMLRISCIDDKEFLQELFASVYRDLPAPKRKSTKK